MYESTFPFSEVSTVASAAPSASIMTTSAANPALLKLYLAAPERFQIKQLAAAPAPPAESINVALTNELLAVAPLVHRIIESNLYSSPAKQVAQDIEQNVLLSLWRWMALNRERRLSALEMEKIAARSAKRGVIAFYRKQTREKTAQIDLDKFDNNETGNVDALGESGNVFSRQAVSSATGTSRAEVASLGKFLFHSIEKLSLRQRFALLLQKSDLIVHLIAVRACRTAEVAKMLELSRPEFLKALSRLPLKDKEIGELWREKTGECLSAKQVWESRAKARSKIKQALG